MGEDIITSGKVYFMGLFDGLKSMFSGKKADAAPATDATPSATAAAPTPEATTTTTAPVADTAPATTPAVTPVSPEPAATPDAPAADPAVTVPAAQTQAETTVPGMPQGATFSENPAPADPDAPVDPTDQQPQA